MFRLVAVEQLLGKLRYKALAFDPNPRSRLENQTHMERFRCLASHSTVFKCSDEDLAFLPDDV